MKKLLVTLIALTSVSFSAYTYLGVSAAARLPSAFAPRYIQFAEYDWEAIDRDQIIAIARFAMNGHENASESWGDMAVNTEISVFLLALIIIVQTIILIVLVWRRTIKNDQKSRKIYFFIGEDGRWIMKNKSFPFTQVFGYLGSCYSGSRTEKNGLGGHDINVT